MPYSYAADSFHTKNFVADFRFRKTDGRHIGIVSFVSILTYV